MNFLRVIAWAAIGPAVYVNIEATPMPWKPGAVLFVVLAAACVYLSWKKKSLGFGALGAAFTVINLTTALGNIASISADTIDGRSSIVERRDAVNRRRFELNEARKVQVVLAGETAVRVFEGQIKGLIASDATRYAASEHCDPDKTSKPETKAFCDKIADLETRKAAAEERVKIDAKLGEVDKETIFGGPAAVDPYAESLSRFLSIFGFQFTSDGKLLLSSSKDWGKTLGLELAASFGPMAMTALFELMLLSHLSRAAPVQPRQPTTVNIALTPLAQPEVAEAEKVEKARQAPKRVAAKKPPQKRLAPPKTVAKDSGPDVNPVFVRNMLADLITEDGKIYYAAAADRLRERLGNDLTPNRIGRLLGAIGDRDKEKGGERATFYVVRAA